MAENNTTPDLDYLHEALQRAGQRLPVGELSVEALTGGRTGAQVERLRVGEDSYVLKVVPISSWRTVGSRIPGGGEGPLWRSGLVSDSGWPVLDVERRGDSWWLLMEDVDAGIRARDCFTWADSQALFGAAAGLHARHWHDPSLDRPGLATVDGITRLFTESALHLSGRRPSDEGWVADMLGDLQVLGAFLPLLLDVLGERWADAYLDLMADEVWREQLYSHPYTLLHGDLRRANIAFQPSGVALFDWDFASRGPAACDLQWHVLLHYWGYPPPGIEAGVDCVPLRDSYLAALRGHGVKVDERAFAESWDLAWIRSIVTLGFALADPLYPDGGTPSDRARTRDLAVRAVQRAWETRQKI